MPKRKPKKLKVHVNLDKDDFYDLPKNEQRKRIAMDVILLLKRNRLKFSSGSLLSLAPEIDKDIEHGKELIEYLQKAVENRKCEVCGVGACLVALVLRADKYKINRNLSEGDSFRKQYKFVAKVFGKRNTELIELAFEQGWGCFGTYVKGGLFKKVTKDRKIAVLTNRAINFGMEYEDDSKRLMKIMENIIEHDGIFTP